LREDRSNYDEVLGKLYRYKVNESDRFTQLDVETFVQIVERTQKRNKVLAALQVARSSAKGNAILTENLIGPHAVNRNDSEGEDEEEEAEKPTSNKESTIRVQPEEEPEQTLDEDEEEPENNDEENQEEPSEFTEET
jgi:hypothetical protein